MVLEGGNHHTGWTAEQLPLADSKVLIINDICSILTAHPATSKNTGFYQKNYLGGN